MGLSGFSLTGLFKSGSSTGTRRSKRPGRRRCRVQGIRTVRRCQNDNAFLSIESIHLGKQLVQGLLTLVVSGESAAVTFLPTVSISSIKTIHGAFSFACWNRSRTFAAPMPTNISTNSEPEMEKNGTFASPATAFASSVLPVPGGPTSSAPFGIFAPISSYFLGLCRKSTISCKISFASSLRQHLQI